ncbi:TPA: nucleotidyltransferase [Legionella pneumophila]|jgi:hypothetical protein|uniref:Cyclic GMP-AMP synthase n=1 Tax=Legionella pneumophila TaxID=446 RepID=A0AAN5KSF2_LEGPN|nr:nucleotidyltransferase [Legionella pneumophila]HAT1971313.1 nucleotidyltransferase [Legionella pneumophila]
MSIQALFETFHKKIKVETDELRDKRDILSAKIKSSINKNGHPTPDIINQGSYIYGVGIKPLNDQEYDIDVGFIFPIHAQNHTPTKVRAWVYDAIKQHTNSVEDRGPCIRVRYAAGFHVDLVIYAKYYNSDNENYQLARNNDTWVPSQPKELKSHIVDARQRFIETRDSTGADQIQRITRYLKRWNDLDIPDDSPNKPSGLATLLLVINSLPAPVMDNNGKSNDLEALILIAQQVTHSLGRIVVKKPTIPYEDLYEKLDDKAMHHLKKRFSSLLSDLEACRKISLTDAVSLLAIQFGSDFPTNFNNSQPEANNTSDLIEDMKKAIPTFKNPAKPWSN